MDPIDPYDLELHADPNFLHHSPRGSVRISSREVDVKQVASVSFDQGRLRRAIAIFARLALGAAFLSGIMSPFGWWGAGVGYGSYENFVRYTGEVNSFMPAYTIRFLAHAATAAELGLGVALVLGVWPRLTALASAALLTIFGTAMAISFGMKSPLDYSVFSAAAAALLLAVEPSSFDRHEADPRSSRDGDRAGASRRATNLPTPSSPHGVSGIQGPLQDPSSPHQSILDPAERPWIPANSMRE
jgi:putative oxidoreductase